MDEIEDLKQQIKSKEQEIRNLKLQISKNKSTSIQKKLEINEPTLENFNSFDFTKIGVEFAQSINEVLERVSLLNDQIRQQEQINTEIENDIEEIKKSIEDSENTINEDREAIKRISSKTNNEEQDNHHYILNEVSRMQTEDLILGDDDISQYDLSELYEEYQKAKKRNQRLQKNYQSKIDAKKNENIQLREEISKLEKRQLMYKPKCQTNSALSSNK